MDRANFFAFEGLRDSIKSFFNNIKGSKTPIDESFRGTADLQNIKAQVIEELGNYGFYKRDDGRIVISAPEVIIGNVNRDGVLLANQQSKLTFRSNIVSIEAPSTPSDEDNSIPGVIKLNAESIINEAINPGLEGEQYIVTNNSKIVNRARTISIDGQDTGDIFMVDTEAIPGVNITSNIGISIKSGTSREIKAYYDDLQTEVSEQITNLQNSIESLQSQFDAELSDMDKLQTDTEELLGDDVGLSTDCYEADEKASEYYVKARGLRETMAICEASIRKLAMLTRLSNSLTDGMLKSYSDSIPTEEGAHSAGYISIVGDDIGVTAVNGDEEETETASIGISAHSISMGTSQGSTESMNETTINMHAETINLDTIASNEDSGTEAVGNVSICSKNIIIESANVDKDGVLSPTPEGGLSLYGNTVEITSQETKEGKVAGTFTLNAKDILLKSVDQDVSDAENVKDKELVAEGKIELFAKNINVGNIGEDEDKLKTEKVTILGKEILVDLKKSEDKFDLNQEDAPIAEVTGSKTTIKSKEGFNIEEGDVTIKTNVTIEGKTEFKDDAKGTKIEAQNLEASAGVKTPKVDK